MKNNLFGAFSERSFLFLWFGEIFTQISVNLFNFFIILVVFLLTKSNTAVSGAIVSFTIPAILFGILAGAYVDRWDKKKVLIVTNLARAVCLIFLAFFHTNLIAIYVISFIIAVLTQFFIPAETPMVPLLVPKSLLLSANALFGMGIYGSILIAYVLSGPLLLLIGQVNTLIFLALFLLLGALCISFIRYPHKKLVHALEPAPKELEIRKEIKSALLLMMRTKEIYSSLFLLALSQILILIIAAVTPGYADKILHMDVNRFPLLFVTPAAIGMVVGASIIVNYFQHVKKRNMISLGLFLSGIAMFILPFASVIASRDVIHTLNVYLPRYLNITNVHMLVIIAFFLGLANALVFVPCNTILQEKSTDEYRGRLYGVLNALVGLFSLIPIILVGSLSDLIGVGNVIIGIGISLFILGLTSRLVK